MRKQLAAIVLGFVLPTIAGADTVKFVHTDAIGNVRVLTSTTGAVLERHDYLPFGEECTTGVCANNPGIANGEALHFTGKERDKETGLDYFGARYYRSNTGRFTTVDPVYTWMDNLVDPQRWNRYAYGRNNPLRYVDPTGKYICGGTTGECTDFEDARQRALKIDDADVQRGASAYGKPGEDNGVNVKFGTPRKGHRGDTTHGIRADAKSANGASIDDLVLIQSGLSGWDLTEVLAHEGSHVADGQEFVATFTPDGLSFNSSKNISQYESEVRAFHVSAAVLAAGNSKAHFRCGTGDCALGVGIRGVQLEQNINKLLGDPGNYGMTAAHPGDKLYQGF
jgi:RHS repeat-associated protein